MTNFAKAWITSLLIATAVGAQEPQTVHLQNGNSQGSGVLCGGTENGSHRIILSVAHVTGTRPGNTMTATVNGRRYKAHLVGADYDADSALLVILGKHLEGVEPARLWMGDIDTDQELRTEGFSGRRFVQTRGGPSHVTNRGRFLEWTSASYPGMSGGPTYVSAKHPTFVTTTTGSDYRTMSVGPYRTWFAKWVPTLETKRYRFTCSSSGMINMIPKGGGRIEGPIAVPRPAPESVSQTEVKPPEVAVDDLKKELGQELQKLLAEQNRPTKTPKVAATPKLEVVEDDTVAEQGEVIVINVPVKLRVTSQPRIRIEVIE